MSNEPRTNASPSLEDIVSPCGAYCTKAGCEHAVKDIRGRWYITMGHAGFNSTANNRDGYKTKAVATAAHQRYRRGN